MWVSWVFFIVSVYSYTSCLEWAIHRHFMHAKSGWRHILMGKNHIEHHTNVKHDMTLDKMSPAGVRIGYKDTLRLAFVFFPGVFSINWMAGTDLSIFTIAVFSLIMPMIHNFMWNSIHSRIHSMNVKYSDGIPGNSRCPPCPSLYQFLLNNHTLHHHDSGCNYNIVFPGADYLFGTFKNKTPLLD